MLTFTYIIEAVGICGKCIMTKLKWSLLPESLIKLICEEKKGQNRKIKGLVTIRLNLINHLIAGDET